MYHGFLRTGVPSHTASALFLSLPLKYPESATVLCNLNRFHKIVFEKHIVQEPVSKSGYQYWCRSVFSSTQSYMCANVPVRLCAPVCSCARVYDVLTQRHGHECSEITVTPPDSSGVTDLLLAWPLSLRWAVKLILHVCHQSPICLSVEGEKGGGSMPAASCLYPNISSIFISNNAPKFFLGLSQYLGVKACGNLSTVDWD